MVLVSSGSTSASHDPASAKASCTSVFRQVESEGGWLVYRQTASGPTTGAGGVLNGPCTVVRAGEAGALRLRPAGRRLKAEVGTSFGGRPPRWEHRSYLSRT